MGGSDLVGWDNFTVGIVEYCDINVQGLRENYYLQKYLPLLNSTFNSNFNEKMIFQTLSDVLKSKQCEIPKSPGCSAEIWVYKYSNTHIDRSFMKYASTSEACRHTGLARSTINRYLDTNVPTKGLLFFSKPLADFNISFSLAKKAEKELSLDPTIAKKVWVNTVGDKNIILVNNQPFNSRELTAKFLNTTHNVIRYFMDSWEGKGFKGYYLFSKPLTKK